MNTEWNKEHEEAKQEFMEKYLFVDMKPSWERQQLVSFKR